MSKDQESRAGELKTLGWPAEAVSRYERLWEYRQRWGAINLEPEEREFLRKAEGELPKQAASGQGGSQKKTTQQKSHYRWLAFYLAAMTTPGAVAGLEDGEVGAWPIILEEELRALDYYEPVLGLPDTHKAKAFTAAREQWASEAAALGHTLAFDFNTPLEALKQAEKTSWKPLRSDGAPGLKEYPVLPAEAAVSFRGTVRRSLVALVRDTFPSLSGTDKPDPPDDWQRS
ncbi:hypothetical protein KBY66_13780 [Synechococcus sp. Tobar12-5m-g]|uniref:hypothetical protein n=1 Tax=unclassified Synechococcus TaxID=2626047 RepID=UPI0020CEEC9D|nr:MULTISPECIES: hypothetical protein [unclassified Synechococcus]MCP9773668.1 hypothetical protein [Synechococcus sp. Tobar12-5m-g]MCP9874641.1 hypothetical protein [Synechococcus sp. Cruz CV-v-12]